MDSRAGQGDTGQTGQGGPPREGDHGADWKEGTEGAWGHRERGSCRDPTAGVLSHFRDPEGPVTEPGKGGDRLCRAFWATAGQPSACVPAPVLVLGKDIPPALDGT